MAIGDYIKKRRIDKSLTQVQLGDRLGVSYQAVSKWERNETLPDTGILLSLSMVLECSVDEILRGGVSMNDMRRVYVKDVQKGIYSLTELGSLIGKENSMYKTIIKSVTETHNMDFENMLSDSYLTEGLVAEILVQDIINGCYVDASEVRTILEHDHWKSVILKYIEENGLK